MKVVGVGVGFLVRKWYRAVLAMTGQVVMVCHGGSGAGGGEMLSVSVDDAGQLQSVSNNFSSDLLDASRCSDDFHPPP